MAGELDRDADATRGAATRSTTIPRTRLTRSRSRIPETYARRLYRRATSRQRALPDFVIVGAPRCGTTSLFNYLIQHPLCVPPALKELNFVHSDHNFGRGASWYRSWFPRVRELEAVGQAHGRARAITGEGTPNYLAHPEAPTRLRSVVPDAKLLVLLRNPADRAWSHYRWRGQRGGGDPLSFADALAAEPERLPDGFAMMADPQRQKWFIDHSYATRGRYADQLQWWYATFPTDQILVLRSEDLYATPAEVFARVCDYLDLPPVDVEVPFSQHTRAVDAGPADPEARAWLADYFGEPNARLLEMTGGAVGWPDP
jgi:hypothetical protein